MWMSLNDCVYVCVCRSLDMHVYVYVRIFVFYKRGRSGESVEIGSEEWRCNKVI